MPKESHKPRHQVFEPSMADWILYQLKQNPLILEVHDTHSILDTHELSEISALISNKEGNNISRLIQLLELFIKNVPALESIEEVNALIRYLISELVELHNNINQYDIKINSAADGYTLNKTCRLITFLDNYINKIKNLTLPEKSTYTKEKTDKISQENRLFSKQRVSYSRTGSAFHQEIAERLKKDCEEIRSLIGSPETMPRGLIITLTMSITQTFKEASKISEELEEKIYGMLMNFLENEQISSDLITLLKNLFPNEQKCISLIELLSKKEHQQVFIQNLIDLSKEEKGENKLCEEIITMLLKNYSLVGDKKLARTINGNKTEFEIFKELRLILKKELHHIRSDYPELAEAGENLQKAIEISKVSP